MLSDNDKEKIVTFMVQIVDWFRNTDMPEDAKKEGIMHADGVIKSVKNGEERTITGTANFTKQI